MALLCLLLWTLVLGAAECNELYQAGAVADDVQLNLDKDDPLCSHHMHTFYRQMSCQPELTPGAKCPTSYKCESLQGRSPDLCYFKGHAYPVGYNLTRELDDLPTPCFQNCQCVRMYEGARFYCPGGGRELKKPNCPAPPGCRHYPFMEDFPCCQRGVTSCSPGGPEGVKCEFGGRSYDEGETFFPSDDLTCTQCVCAAGFNGTVAAPYCSRFSCVLELWGDTPVMLTRGCIPVYLSEHGCCPVAYRCPKPSDKIVKTAKKLFPDKTDKSCRFGNLTLEVGDQLSPWKDSENTRKISCSCRVPPLASCVRRGFTLTEELRRDLTSWTWPREEGEDGRPGV